MAEAVRTQSAILPRGRGAFALAPWLLFAVPWLIYLAADTYVTMRVRAPIPALLAFMLILTVPWAPPVRATGRGLLPPWALGLLLVFALSAIRDPGSNLVYVTVALSTIWVFRLLVGSDPKRYRKVCLLFYGVLVLSSGVLLLSSLAPEVGLGVRYLFFGEVVLLQPVATGLSPMIHTYGYQAAALGAIGLVLAQAHGRQRSLWSPAASIPLAHAAAVLVFAWQRSAVLSAFIAAAVLIMQHSGRVLLRLSLLGALFLGAALSLVPGDKLTAGTVIEKNRFDTHKEHRLELQLETVRVIADHPWGLITEGRQWDRSIFEWGGALSARELTGHNAYLMKIVYLGLPAALMMLAILYPALLAASRHGLAVLKGPAGPWPAAMALVLVATLVNALMHNASLFTAEGSTIFSYVAVWHWHDMQAQARSA